MNITWDDTAVKTFVGTGCSPFPHPFLEMVYATRLLGTDPDLALHGGGNTSYKGAITDLTGGKSEALFIKASGCDMGKATKDDFVILDRNRLGLLSGNTHLDDSLMSDIFATSLLYPHPSSPSIETLLHAFLPFQCIIHTHPAPILALTNRMDADSCTGSAFSLPFAVIDYEEVGIALARRALAAVKTVSGCRGLVIRHHGLVTWGENAKEAFEATITLKGDAETWIASRRKPLPKVIASPTTPAVAKNRYRKLAPLIRGCLTPPVSGSNGRQVPVSLVHRADKEILDLLEDRRLSDIITTTPLTADHIIRVRRLPLFVHHSDSDDPDIFREGLTASLAAYTDNYEQFAIKEQERLHRTLHSTLHFLPLVLLIPGIGIVCAGPTLSAARIAADITLQAIAVKRSIHETGGIYEELGDRHCFNMEFRSYQRAKLSSPSSDNGLKGRIVLVTGAAGAIGSGVCAFLLKKGCHIAVSDLPGKQLETMTADFVRQFGDHALAAVPMDVTDEQMVHDGFRTIIDVFGGLDAVIVNAGIAHVATLTEMELDAFRNLEKVNTEGTLLTIREAARLFDLQNTGGDIVLVSTKNVFAPGASFGAYSATKAASHQLARIASLELAPIDVRVNMVAPDAVFSHGSFKSGLWETVGPDRMKSRGLDQKGLEEYYRNRNLLKTKVTADHVAAAVEFFLSRKTPTTGATLPVDGGLPDATPR